MSNNFYIAASGMQTEQFHIQQLSNDIANLNTQNYKTGEIMFSDVLYQDIPANVNVFSHYKNTQIGLGTAISKTTKDFSQGPLIVGKQNNIAINGPGFIQLQMEDGSIAYTRNSSFTIDKDGYLSTTDGYRYLDQIQIPQDARKIIVGENGDIFVYLDESDEPQNIGTIKLAGFVNPEELTAMGNGIYSENERTGIPQIDIPGNSHLGTLLQGKIEGANVDMAKSLMELTLAQRIYGLNAKALKIADELDKSNNDLI